MPGQPAYPDSGISVAELEALVALLKRARLTGAHLEIGTAKGGTLRELMQAYPAASRPRFVAIDTFDYFPDQRRVVEGNLRKGGIDPATVEFRAATSWAALKDALARNERFSFMLIDADHNADHVIQDLTWTRLLDPGGYVCLHDYGREFPGVVWAADRFLRKYRNYARAGLAETLLILRKEGDSATHEVSRIDLAAGLAVRPLQRLHVSIRRRFRRMQARGKAAAGPHP